MSDRGRYIVEAIVLEHRSPSELARTHKVSRSWIYKMLERFKRSCAHQVEARVQKLILKLRRDLTAAEDDPERAVRAALEIRRGISESPVTAGEVVSSAQRLQVAAPVSAILVGEQTYRTTREVIDYSEAAPTAAKAGAGAILAWHALAALPRRGVDLVREPRTPLVGRKRELELLVSTLTRAIEERSPQFVTLVGVPGIGKSRLVFELSKRFDQEREQITWRQGRCLSYGDGVSFWALGEIVKAQAGILETDRPDQAEEKLRKAVAALPLTMDEATWVEREIWPLIGSSGERSPEERSEERFAAWRCFLEAMAERKPLVLALEDLHWADDGLLDFLEELADRLRDAPLLVLCTARPEFLERRPAWGGGKTNVVTIALAPLSEDETGQLLEAVLEQRELEAEVREALVARAAGNPLYAEQFARVLEEIGAVQQLPETVQGIIAARIDGLPLADKAVLQDAAVIGKVFWPDAVEAIGDIPHREVRGRLVSLERKEFVQQARRSSVAGEPEYSFRHILLRDVAYAQIPRAARGERHRRAAGWIQSLGRPDDHAEVLAHHYLKALDYTRATEQGDSALAEHARLALRAAGQRALALASYAAAARFYSSALELWPESDAARVSLLVEAGRARHAADGTGIDLLEQAFQQLAADRDLEAAAEVGVDIARRFWLSGDRDRAYEYIDRALALTDDRRDSRSRAYALVERAAYHMNASDNAQASRLAAEALPLTDAPGMDDVRIRALDVLGSSRTFTGNVA